MHLEIDAGAATAAETDEAEPEKKSARTLMIEKTLHVCDINGAMSSICILITRPAIIRPAEGSLTEDYPEEILSRHGEWTITL